VARAEDGERELGHRWETILRSWFGEAHDLGAGVPYIGMTIFIWSS